MAQAEFKGEEFEFPDEKEAKGKAAEAVEAKLEVEVEDDTPEEDRNRKPAATPPEDPSDDELASYDEKVQSRIKKFTKGYHDERRAKEQALREREAAETYARQMLEENKKLQQQLSTSTKYLVEQSQFSAKAALDAAKKQYKEAYEAGDADALTEAQEAVAKATLKLDQAEKMKPLQPQQNSVQPAQPSNAPRVSPKDQQWLQSNTWFGTDPEMTATALGLHQKLERTNGAQFIGSDEYYKAVDATMRKRFPEYFGSDGASDAAPESKASDPADEDEPPRRASKPAVVAPASRSTPPNRIRLKASEAAIARRLGVPLEEYARQVAQLKRNA